MDINNIKIEPNFNINLNKKNKSVGILNNGKGNKFINNKIYGLDVGIQDNGQDTLAQGNDIR